MKLLPTSAGISNSQGNVTSSQASPTRTFNDFDLVLVNLNHCSQPSK